MIELCTVDDVSTTVACKEISGLSIAYVLTSTGIAVFRNRCTHLEFPLDGSQIDSENTIACGWHGAVFRLPSGEVVAGPDCPALTTIEFTIDNAKVFIDDPAN